MRYVTLQTAAKAYYALPIDLYRSSLRGTAWPISPRGTRCSSRTEQLNQKQISNLHLIFHRFTVV